MTLPTWIKPASFLTGVLVAVWLLPSGPIDPWGIFSPKQITKVIFALAFIQALGSFAIHRFGFYFGTRITGFIGGLISSTATTVLVARESHDLPEREVKLGVVTILSATVAMMVEVATIIMVGTNQYSLLLILVGPVLTAEAIVFFLLHNIRGHDARLPKQEFRVLPVLKLTVFIVLILGASKVAQNIFGARGLFVLTFLVSLFEMHGSVVANLGLYEAGIFNMQVLAALIMLSGLASYLSKMFLISTLGSADLKKFSLKPFLALIFSLIASWLIFLLVSA